MYAVTEDPGERYPERSRGVLGSGKADDSKGKVADQRRGNAMATGNKWTDDGRPICRRCGGEGHMELKCPSTSRVSALMCNAVSQPRRDADLVLLDLGAETSLFTDDFYLDNVVKLDKVEYAKGAVGDESFPVHQEGFLGCIPVLLSKDAQVSLLAAEDVRKYYDMYAVEGWGTRVVHKSTGQTLDFVLRGSTQHLDMTRSS